MTQAPSFDEYRQMKHFDALDGMRAIGVVIVIFEHCGGHFVWLSGWLGVHIFFVMSGFLITTLLLREQERNGHVSLRDFYIRRIFRIMPVYYLIFAITVVQTHALGGESWEQLRHSWPYYVAFLGEQQFSGPWKLVWTMGIEWKFYLVWPIILFLVPLGPKGMFFVTSVTLFIFYRLWDNPIAAAPHYIVLLFGAIAAILLHHRRTFNMLRVLMSSVASVVLFACVALMQIYGIHIRSIAGGYGGAQGIVLYGIVVALFLPSLLGNSP
jgi:peptidoglycan/LPS O-acetylase OafA/YrhL